jgi:hypothetical protein
MLELEVHTKPSAVPWTFLEEEEIRDYRYLLAVTSLSRAICILPYAMHLVYLKHAIHNERYHRGQSQQFGHKDVKAAWRLLFHRE